MKNYLLDESVKMWGGERHAEVLGMMIPMVQTIWKSDFRFSRNVPRKKIGFPYERGLGAHLKIYCTIHPWRVEGFGRKPSCSVWTNGPVESHSVTSRLVLI